MIFSDAVDAKIMLKLVRSSLVVEAKLAKDPIDVRSFNQDIAKIDFVIDLLEKETLSSVCQPSKSALQNISTADYLKIR